MEDDRPGAEERKLHTLRSDTANRISDELGETEESARTAIYKIVKKLGVEEAQRWLTKAIAIEQAGGLMLPDDSRRRTPGGVFFFLVRTEGDPEIVKHLFFKPQNKKKKQKKVQAPSAPAAPAQPALPTATWADHHTLIAEIEQKRGKTSNVKITVIGKPGPILERQGFVLTLMEQNKLPSLPKGLPAPEQLDDPTTYAVYIAQKQWKKVAPSLEDPEDVLIVEGVPLRDKQLPDAIVVFASNVTTKNIQAATRQEKASN